MKHSPRQKNERGSVLVLVLTLLVLLALMGTAFIAVARVDSTALTGTGAPTNSTGTDFGPSDKTKVSDALSLTTTLVENAIVNDLFDLTPTTTDPAQRDFAKYRTNIGTNFYKNYDGFSLVAYPTVANDPDDGYLAARLPKPFDHDANPSTPDNPYWPIVSRWFGPATQFESPRNLTAYGAPTTLNVGGRRNFVPTAIRVNPPTTAWDATPRHRVYPAFDGYTLDSSNPITVFSAATGGIDPATNADDVIAGDTDGDGVADAGLFRLDLNGDGTLNDDVVDPTIGTIRYYAAVRVVDNGSAVNVNTAFCRAGDFDLTAAVPTNFNAPTYGTNLTNVGFFRSNIGLIELFDRTSATNDLTRLLEHRFGTGAWPLTAAYDGAGAARTDYTYLELGDALEQNVARGPTNTGYLDPSTRFGAFAPSASASALGYRYLFTNPGQSRSAVESVLEDSLYLSARNYASDPAKMFRYYPADRYSIWYNASLNYPDPMLASSGNVSLNVDGSQPTSTAPHAKFRGWRPLMVATNALTNHAPWPAFPTNFTAVVGQVITTSAPAVGPTTGPELMPDYGTTNEKLGKTCVNTAEFGELWRAYWAVMCDRSTAANTDNFETTATTAAGVKSIAIMRGSTTMTPKQLLLLRAAVAAANAMELRDSDEDITPHVVDLPDAGGTALSARVYGTEKQPFITNATLQVDGSLTFKLFNPYKDAAPRNFPFLRLVRANRTGPGGAFVLTDITAAAVNFTAASTGLAGEAESTTVSVPSSESLLDAELYLMRTPDAAGANTNLDEWIPLDQFDFRGLAPVAPLFYQRNIGASQGVYPGEYNVAAIGPTSKHVAFTVTSPGTITVRTIQLSNLGWPGPNPVAGATGNAFPFGTFARDGDLLQIPFIGAYRVYNATAATIVGTPTTAAVEMNSVTMDAAIASTPTETDTTEEIGRFCATLTGYEFGEDLFDFLTAQQNPKDDLRPNVNSTEYTNASGAAAPSTVKNDTSTTANVDEDSVGVEGRINVNTAPWQVLNMLPLAVDGTNGQMNATSVTQNETLAKAIVTERETNGPYTSLFNLITRVPTLNGFGGAAVTNPTNATGDVTPITPAASDDGDGVSGDFESKYAAMIRLSNLASVRSDSYTVYVLVQGWVNFGTANPRLVTEARRAFVLDRSAIRPGKATLSDLKLINIPVD